MIKGVLFIILIFVCHSLNAQLGDFKFEISDIKGKGQIANVFQDQNNKIIIYGNTDSKDRGQDLFLNIYDSKGIKLIDKVIGAGQNEYAVNFYKTNFGKDFILSGNRLIGENYTGLITYLNEELSTIWYKYFIGFKILQVVKYDSVNVVLIKDNNFLKNIKVQFISNNGTILSEKELENTENAFKVFSLKNDLFIVQETESGMMSFSHFTDINQPPIKVDLDKKMEINGVTAFDNNSFLLYGSIQTTKYKKDNQIFKYYKIEKKLEFYEAFGGHNDDEITALVKNFDGNFICYGNTYSHLDLAKRQSNYYQILNSNAKLDKKDEVNFIDKSKQNDFVKEIILGNDGDLFLVGVKNAASEFGQCYLEIYSNKNKTTKLDNEGIVISNFSVNKANKKSFFVGDNIDFEVSITNNSNEFKTGLRIVVPGERGNSQYVHLPPILPHTTIYETGFFKTLDMTLNHKSISLTNTASNELISEKKLNFVVEENQLSNLKFESVKALNDEIYADIGLEIDVKLVNKGNGLAKNHVLLISELNKEFKAKEILIEPLKSSENKSIRVNDFFIDSKASKLFISVNLLDENNNKLDEWQTSITRILSTKSRMDEVVSSIGRSLDIVSQVSDLKNENETNTLSNQNSNLENYKQNNTNNFYQNKQGSNSKIVINQNNTELSKQDNNENTSPVQNTTNTVNPTPVKPNLENVSKSVVVNKYEIDSTEFYKNKAKEKEKKEAELMAEIQKLKEKENKPAMILTVGWISPDVLLPENKDSILVTSEVLYIVLLANSSEELSESNFEVLLNEKPYRQGQKFEKVKLNKQVNSQQYKFENELSLVRGMNTIYVNVKNKAGSISSQQIKVVFEPTKPNLFVYAFGVPHIDLKYTTNDAADFAKVIESKAKPIYNKVEVQLFNTPQNTTAKEMVLKLHELKKQAIRNNKFSPKDVVMIYISSHGEVDGDNFLIRASDYDDMAMDITTVNVRTKISDNLGELKCKKLLFVDACQSLTSNSTGAKGGNMDIEKAEAMMKSLASIVGTSSLFSCDKSQQSYEDDNWQNGAFTEAIIEALDSQSKISDANGDNIITLDEVANYIKNRVPKLVSAFKPKNAIQTPVFVGDGLGGVVMGVTTN